MPARRISAVPGAASGIKRMRTVSWTVKAVQFTFMAWAGTGVIWTVSGGVLSSKAFGQNETVGELHFVQISDSHIGFSKPANPNPTATLQTTVEKINAL